MILPKLQGTPSEYRRIKHTQMRALFVVHLMSSIVSAAYEIFNLLDATDRACDEYISGQVVLNSLINLTIRVIDYIAPMWIVLWVFWNWRKGLPHAVPRTNGNVNSNSSPTSSTYLYGDADRLTTIEEDELDVSVTDTDDKEKDVLHTSSLEGLPGL